MPLDEIVPADTFRSITNFVDGMVTGILSSEEQLREAQRRYDTQFPTHERKCIDCAGDGVITVFSVTTGEPLCTAICPTCRGTRYAP